MSRGPGQIERRIGELFAASRVSNTSHDNIRTLRAAIAGLSGTRAFSVADICDHAFALGGAPAGRAQRLSATRAGHRLLRRVRDADVKADRLVQEAHANTEAALGRERRHITRAGIHDDEYQDRLEADPAWQAHKKLAAFCQHIGIWTRLLRGDERGTLRIEHDYWCATETATGLLYFHPPDVPVRVWAVSIQPAGVIWADAEVVKVTEPFQPEAAAGATGAQLDPDDV
jgi:hypothetical protein